MAMTPERRDESEVCPTRHTFWNTIERGTQEELRKECDLGM